MIRVEQETGVKSSNTLLAVTAVVVADFAVVATDVGFELTETAVTGLRNGTFSEPSDERTSSDSIRVAFILTTAGMFFVVAGPDRGAVNLSPFRADSCCSREPSLMSSRRCRMSSSLEI